MQFLNNTTLDQVIGKEVTVYLKTKPGSTVVEAAEMCSVFLAGDVPCIDFIPKLDRKYTAPIPDDAIISRNEVELSTGRYGVFVGRETSAGKLLEAILEAKKSGA